MSEIQEIDVHVKPDGTVSVEVRGVQGRKCLDLTQEMEKLLGGLVVERTFTDEFDREEVGEEIEESARQDR